VSDVGDEKERKGGLTVSIGGSLAIDIVSSDEVQETRMEMGSQESVHKRERDGGEEGNRSDDEESSKLK
jgi:hypothetical protein